ncbi:MAG: hypothetical protein ACHQ4H_11760 [Ktedonobacterales bacterium]
MSLKMHTEQFDAEAGQALGEPLLASLLAPVRNWHALLSAQSAPFMAQAALHAVFGPIGELAGEAAGLTVDKGVEAHEEQQSEQAESTGDYHQAEAWMKPGEQVYLACTPTRFAIYHLGGLVHTSLHAPILLAPRSAVVGCDITDGHLVYFPLTLDLAVHLADGTTLHFGLIAHFRPLAERLQGALTAAHAPVREVASGADPATPPAPMSGTNDSSKGGVSGA